MRLPAGQLAMALLPGATGATAGRRCRAPLLHGSDKTEIACLPLGRDYTPHQHLLAFLQKQLSRLKAEGSDGVGCAVAARELLPDFMMTDESLPELNALSLSLNGVK